MLTSIAQDSSVPEDVQNHDVENHEVENNSVQHELIQFLQDDLALPDPSITLALQHSEQATNLLPMVLWQYGLITIAQLERIFDWLDNHRSMPQEVYSA